MVCEKLPRVVSICCLCCPSRLHDIRGGAAVHRVGPFLRHVSVPDHAGPHGAEQGQLGRPATGTIFDRRGDGTQCGRRG